MAAGGRNEIWYADDIQAFSPRSLAKTTPLATYLATREGLTKQQTGGDLESRNDSEHSGPNCGLKREKREKERKLEKS